MTCAKEATFVCTKMQARAAKLIISRREHTLITIEYCSKGCQTWHWPLHISACEHPMADENWVPQWFAKGRTPRYADGDLRHEYFSSSNARKHLWGNISTIDIVKLENNEGVGYKQDLRLLFAGMFIRSLWFKIPLKLAIVALGDLRNVVMSKSGLPKHYEGRCEVYMNELNYFAENNRETAVHREDNPYVAHRRVVLQ